MATDISICNMALARAGVLQQITTLADSSAHAKACARFYEAARQGMLQEFTWPFAEQVITLSEASGVTVPGWSYVFTYPTGVARVNRLVGTERNPLEPVPFRILSRTVSTVTTKLLAADTYTVLSPLTLDVWVNADVTDESLFDPLFVDALAWRLAKDLAPVLSQDNEGFTTRAEQQYEMAIRRATAAHLNEQGADPDRCSFTEAYE